MKTYFYFFLMAFTIGYTPKTDTLQDTLITKEVVYEGYDEDGFYFLYDNDLEGEYIVFKTISKEILEKHDLKSEEFFNKDFEITYKIKSVGKEDEDLELITIDVL